MPDIMMVFNHLHNQIGGFNGNIQTECFAKFFFFKNRLARKCTDVAAQKIGAVPGTELFFKIINQALCKGIDLLMRVSRRIPAEQDAQGHNAANQGTA